MTNVLSYILLALILLLPSFAQAEDAASGDKASTQPPATEAKPENKSENNGASPDSTASEALKASKEEEEQKKKQTVTEVVPQEGGVISGKFELDVTETYTHQTSDQLYIDGFGILPIVVVGDVRKRLSTGIKARFCVDCADARYAWRAFRFPGYSNMIV